MKEIEKVRIVDECNKLTDKELEYTYYDILYSSLGSQVEIMYELGYDKADILEREKYERYLLEKCDIIGKQCEKRGIKLFAS